MPRLPPRQAMQSSRRFRVRAGSPLSLCLRLPANPRGRPRRTVLLHGRRTHCLLPGEPCQQACPELPHRLGLTSRPLFCKSRRGRAASPRPRLPPPSAILTSLPCAPLPSRPPVFALTPPATGRSSQPCLHRPPRRTPRLPRLRSPARPPRLPRLFRRLWWPACPIHRPPRPAPHPGMGWAASAHRWQATAMRGTPAVCLWRTGCTCARTLCRFPPCGPRPA